MITREVGVDNRKELLVVYQPSLTCASTLDLLEHYVYPVSFQTEPKTAERMFNRVSSAFLSQHNRALRHDKDMLSDTQGQPQVLLDQQGGRQTATNAIALPGALDRRAARERPMGRSLDPFASREVLPAGQSSPVAWASTRPARRRRYHRHPPKAARAGAPSISAMGRT